MSDFELIINDGNTLHRTVEDAKETAYHEQIERWDLDHEIDWYETDHGWEGFNELGFYLIRKAVEVSGPEGAEPDAA